MSKTSIITNSPDSEVKGNTLEAGAKINVLLFKSEDDFNSFLKSIGVPEVLMTPTGPPNWSTYFKAIGLALLSRSLKRHTSDYHNYLKRGQSAKFDFGPQDQLLVIFVADNWTFLAKQSISPGVDYTVTTINRTTSWGRHSATIIPS